VQYLPGDAAVALHPAGNLLPGHPQRSPETRGLRQHTSLFRFAKLEFGQPDFSQIRETKNRAYELQREDHCTPEYFRMKCVWKNLLRRHLEFRCLPEVCFLIFVYWSWRRDLNP
jgi:hypothetical protein